MMLIVVGERYPLHASEKLNYATSRVMTKNTNEVGQLRRAVSGKLTSYGVLLFRNAHI